MLHPRTLAFSCLLAAIAFGLGVMSTISQAPAAEDQPATKPAAEKTTDELSYTLGYVISHRLANLGVELDVPAFADGFKTARSDAPLKVSEERMQQLLDQFSEQRLATVDQPDDGDKPTPAERTAEEKRKAMAEQMQQRPSNAPPSATQLQIGGQVPKGRINAAVDTTRRVTREADAPEVREQQ